MPAMLDDAVDELYTAFASRNRPAAIDHCSHCVDPADIERLLASGPLREIPVERLRRYAAKVLSTAGNVQDFRYFLPRILHIAVTDGFDHPDLGIVMGKIRKADWRGWPEREQEAVTGLVRALWSSTLTRFPAAVDAEEVLAAAGELEDDLTPYLLAWEATLTHRAGASHLHAFVRDHVVRAGTGLRPVVPHWPAAAAATVSTWLGDLTTTVATMAETVTDDETGDVLLETLVLL